MKLLDFLAVGAVVYVAARIASRHQQQASSADYYPNAYRPQQNAILGQRTIEIGRHPITSNRRPYDYQER